MTTLMTATELAAPISARVLSALEEVNDFDLADRLGLDYCEGACNANGSLTIIDRAQAPALFFHRWQNTGECRWAALCDDCYENNRAYEESLDPADARFCHSCLTNYLD